MKSLMFSLAAASAVAAFAHTADTIAFYAFDEGADGESAVGKTIANDIDAALYPGTAEVKSSATVAGSVLYSDDAPGKYVFNGVDGDLICTGPKSLRYGGQLNCKGGVVPTAGGNVSFADLGTALSKLDAYTVEFFWKIEPGENKGMYNNTSIRSVKWNSGFITTCETAGHVYSDEVPNPVGMNLPEYANTIRVWAGADDQNVNCYPCNIFYNNTCAIEPVATISDGKWHHIAVTFDKTTCKLSAVADYIVKYGGSSKTLPGSQELTTSEPLDLGCFYHRGRFACLRVSSKVLSKEEFMYVSSDAHFYPDKGDTVFHLRLNGTNGETLDSATKLENAVPSYRDANTNIFYASTSAIVESSVDGTGRAYVDDDASPVWTNAVPNARKTFVYPGDDRDLTPIGETTGSVRIEPAAVYDASSSWMVGAPGFYMPYNTYNRVDSGNWTCECFFHFDKSGWLKKNKVAGYPRASIMGARWDGHNSLWKVYFDFDKPAAQGLPDETTAIRLYLQCQPTSGSYVSKSYYMTKDKGMNDDKWHHLAVVYDDSAMTLTSYLDYEKLTTLTLPVPLTMYQNAIEREIRFGYGLNDQTFMGEIDEARLSRVILEPSQFLHMMRPPRQGMMVIVR